MIWGITTEEAVRRIEAREARGFIAWWPKQLKDGKWCWLERYTREYWSSWGCSGYDYHLYVEK